MDFESKILIGNQYFLKKEFGTALKVYFQGVVEDPSRVNDFLENIELVKIMALKSQRNQLVVLSEYFDVGDLQLHLGDDVEVSKKKIDDQSLDYVLKHPIRNFLVCDSEELVIALMYKLVWGAKLFFYTSEAHFLKVVQSEIKSSKSLLSGLDVALIASQFEQLTIDALVNGNVLQIKDYNVDLQLLTALLVPQVLDAQYFNEQIQQSISMVLDGIGESRLQLLSRLNLGLFDTKQLKQKLLQPLEGDAKRIFKTFSLAAQNRYVISLLLNREKNAVKLPKLSIVMPSYNREASIVKAIDSVIQQTYQNWELFVVDDGSTDDTKNIVSNFAKKDRRIALIEGEHGGVSHARNLGLAQISGEYVFYLDSDNAWNPIYLESMLNAFQVSGAKTGYSGIELRDDQNEVLAYRGERFDWDQCLYSNYIDLNAFAHHASLMQSEGAFDTTLKRMVDWDLILRYTKNNHPFFLPLIGCLYYEGKQDANRITMKEPMAFHRVVKVKNELGVATSEIINDLHLKIAIKIPAPFDNRNEWGDFHYAESLKQALEAQGHHVELDFYGQWYKRPALKDDVIIVLRGLHAYQTVKGPINILWNISHPDQVSYNEYERYDYVFVPSYSYADFLAQIINVPVIPLLQCTDISRFFYNKNIVSIVDGLVQKKRNKTLFVGNSRNEYREIVKLAIEADLDVDVYGTRWQQFIPKKYIKAENVANDHLAQYYSNYGVVLNDHWESMKVYGFMSNRIFDVLGSGGQLVSDFIPSIRRFFNNEVSFIGQGQDLEQVVDGIIDHKSVKHSLSVSNYVHTFHSFNRRAQTIENFVFNRLGLPARFVAADVIAPYEQPKLRKKLGVLTHHENQYQLANYFQHLSPLLSESVNEKTDVIIGHSLENLLQEQVVGVFVALDYFKSDKDVVDFLDFVQEKSISYYLTINGLGENQHILSVNIREQLCANAAHVIFTTEQEKLNYRAYVSNASVVPLVLDPRLWRNYRKAAPLAKLMPKYRVLCNCLYVGSAIDIHELISNFAEFVTESGLGVELHLYIDAQVNVDEDYSWLKVRKVNTTEINYPRVVEMLTTAEQYDFAILPAQLDDDLAYVKFLEYSAIGVLSILPKHQSLDHFAQQGLLLFADDYASLFQNIKFIAGARHLGQSMIQRAWENVWQENEFLNTTDQYSKIIGQPLEVMKFQSAKQKHLLTKKVSTKQVAVCLHLYYLHMWDQIKAYLGNIEHEFDLFITCPEHAFAAVEKKVHQAFPSCKVLAVPNKGMDVYAFLLANNAFALWSYDVVLKLHTKNDKSDDGRTFGLVCLDSLLGERAMIKNIIQQFLDDPSTGIVGAEMLYRSAQALMYVNRPWVNKLVDTLHLPSSEADWGFFAGTMFWINGALLKVFADHFYALEGLLNSDIAEIVTGGDGSWAHAMERLFTYQAHQLDYKTYLTYPLHIDGRHRSIRQLLDGELEKNNNYRVSSMWYIPRFANLKKWNNLLVEQNAFDERAYLQSNHVIIPKEMDANVHYLLYGDDLRLDPNDWFSTEYYRGHNMDVVRARVCLLIHYMLHGKNEGRLGRPDLHG